MSKRARDDDVQDKDGIETKKNEDGAMKNFKDTIDKKAREIVSDVFPQKIKAMQALYLEFREEQLKRTVRVYILTSCVFFFISPLLYFSNNVSSNTFIF